jgi:tetratricopeptide (TPR) repeat protein
VFISAVSRELRSARQLVANTLSFLGYEPVWQDIFGTESGDLRGVLCQQIDHCKGVVQLIGQCYGAEPPTPDEEFGRVSYTQYEALYARKRGKKVWYLFIDENFPADPYEEESQEKQKLQEAYREKVKADVHLYHALNSREALETSVLKLRDDLTSLRRGVRRWAVAVLSLLLIVAVGIAWLVHSQHRQAIALQIQSQQVSAIRQALARLPEVEAQTKQSGEKLAPEEQRARAYAVLEKELGLSTGTLAKELPLFALQLYNRSDTTPLLRARAAYALNKFDEAEKLGLQAAEQDEKAYESANRVANERRKAALEAYEIAGWSADKRVQYADALAYLRKAEQLSDRARDPLEWARVQFAIGWVLFNQGQYQQAESTARDVLNERERVLGPEHPDTISARHYVARSVLLQGRYAEAETEYRQLVKWRERILGNEHPDTLASRNNLALALDGEGKHGEAETEDRGILELENKALGPEHFSTLSTRMNLGAVLCEEGKYVEAEKEDRAVLEVAERVLGSEDPVTMGARSNMAEAFCGEGRYAEAEEQERIVFKIAEKVLGPDHPNTLVSRSNLADDLSHEGKYPQAEAEHRAVLELRERVLGLDHPDTLVTCYNLARCLQIEDKKEEAALFARRAAEGAQKALGPDHPETKKYQDLWRDLDPGFTRD